MARADFRFAHPFRVRYAETDAQGVVFNANYLTYYDVAITEYLRVIGWDYKAHIGTGVDFHIVKGLVEYKGPLRFDDEFEVAVRTARLGNSSLTFALEVHPKGRDRVLATGEVVWVNTDQTSHKPAPVPNDLRTRIERYEQMGAAV
ncbi:MAG TPA: thioesterase family protein [Azospirillaceae bacterium]|nr:thioesterase family protein [Azospirillaceae bacterium]